MANVKKFTLEEAMAEIQRVNQALAAADQKIKLLINTDSENQQLKEALTNSELAFKELEKHLEAAQSSCGGQCKSKIEELSLLVSTLSAEKELLNGTNDELTAKIEELSEALESNSGQKEALKIVHGSLPCFEHGGKAYKFTSPVFKYKQIRHTAADVVNNTELLEELISAGVGVIVPQ